MRLIFMEIHDKELDHELLDDLLLITNMGRVNDLPITPGRAPRTEIHDVLETLGMLSDTQQRDFQDILITHAPVAETTGLLDEPARFDRSLDYAAQHRANQVRTSLRARGRKPEPELRRIY